MRKKTVEVPQVQYIAKLADVQFKEMNPWRYRGRFQGRRLSRRLWRYLEICGRTSDQGAASSHDQEKPFPVQVPRGSRRRDHAGFAGDATPGSSGTDSADNRGDSSTAVHRRGH